MRTPRNWLRRWLGIESLGLYVELTRKQIGLEGGIPTITKEDGTVDLANKPIKKGYEPQL